MEDYIYENIDDYSFVNKSQGAFKFYSKELKLNDGRNENIYNVKFYDDEFRIKIVNDQNNPNYYKVRKLSKTNNPTIIFQFETIDQQHDEDLDLLKKDIDLNR